MAEIVKGKIGNALTSTAADHVVAVADDIFDEQLGKYQSILNALMAVLITCHFQYSGMSHRVTTVCNALFMPFAIISVFLLYSILHKEVKPFGMRHGTFQFFGWTDFNIQCFLKFLNGHSFVMLFHFVSSLYVIRCLELQSKQLNLSLPSNSR